MPAFYSSHIREFLKDDNSFIIGELTANAGKAGFYQQQHSQTKSWGIQINILKHTLLKLSEDIRIDEWGILLEYPIPRRAKRIDTVILASNLVFVLEFKIGSNGYYNNDKIQVEDYCLDLRDFHKESSNKTLFPILVASEAPRIEFNISTIKNNIHDVILANKESIKTILKNCYARYGSKEATNLDKWNNSEYVPTPTIIQAAQHIYSGQNVKEISRSQAGADNLTKTTAAVIAAINKAKEEGKKIICFITGVPGAGKTLAGLNIVHNNKMQTEGDLGVFLSGNSPLIKVLTEALAKDNSERTNQPISESRRRVSTFIHNVHNFLDEYFNDPSKVPVDNVVLFDEAQRAWDSEQSKRKFNRDFSEPEMMLSIMDRQPDWAIIVALVGGGQEINTGEAGLAEWGKNLISKFPHWQVYISPELKEGHHSTAGIKLFEMTPKNIKVFEKPELHLKISIRSYKAELLSKWVNELLEGHLIKANEILRENLSLYPIVYTRNLDTAKAWLKEQCRGSRRCGLVATSGARRLRPYGLDVTYNLDEPIWFLNDKDDVRSSSFLELVATEFAVQGLELDWVGLCWDADLRRDGDGWKYFQFVGTKWQNVRIEQKKQYILNKYRVLLTRAREGLVIWIPRGSDQDDTRNPQFYECTADYLKNCGIIEI